MKFYRTSWFKYFLGIALTIATYVSFVTPIAGYFQDVANLTMQSGAKSVAVRARLVKPVYDSAGYKYIYAKDFLDQSAAIRVSSDPGVKVGEVFVARLAYIPAQKGMEWVELVRINPMMTFPLIPGLGELGRNMIFHVPMSMVAFLAFLMGTINSIMYLRKKDLDYDKRARAHSAAGTLFTVLATITGSIWARFSWGSFWNWDPRETSIFILLLIYMAYFILRSLLEESEDKKARIAAVYNIISFVSVPFLMFVLPRITQSLHPGGGGTEAPIINANGKSHVDPTLSRMLWINVLLFAMLYAWITDLYTRLLRLEDREA